MLKRMFKYIFLILFIISIDNRIMAFKKYKVGDEIEYNNMYFYVIKDSGESDDSILLLKGLPLTVEEVNQYGIGHINRYTRISPKEVYNSNGFGGMTYYTSETCGDKPVSGVIGWQYTGTECFVDYSKSDIKFAVDGWATDNLNVEDLNKDSTGYSVRLIMYDDIVNLGYTGGLDTSARVEFDDNNIGKWFFNEKYSYWTMSLYEDTNTINTRMWVVGNHHFINSTLNEGDTYTVRPVVNLKKKALVEGEEFENIESNDDNSYNDLDKNEIKFNDSDEYEVADTYSKKSLMIIIIGFFFAGLGIVTYYIFIKKIERK